MFLSCNCHFVRFRSRVVWYLVGTSTGRSVHANVNFDRGEGGGDGGGHGADEDDDGPVNSNIINTIIIVIIVAIIVGCGPTRSCVHDDDRGEDDGAADIRVERASASPGGSGYPPRLLDQQRRVTKRVLSS